jgi:hypothetical protein
VPFRQWRTDIGVTRLAPDRFDVALETIHWILPDYIGEEPGPPIPSAPRIVSLFLRGGEWRGFAGSLQLSADPVPLEAGNGKEFMAILEGRERKCPVVLVTRDYPTGEFAVDPSRLARLLAGTAVVFAATSSAVDKELEWLFDRNYRCWGGMIRVYQPAVRFDSDRDFRRHRYFTRQQIDDLAPDRVIELIVRAITRRSRADASGELVSQEHVALREREFKFAQLRSKPGDQVDRELLGLYEEENRALTERNRELTDALESRRTEFHDLQDAKDLLELEVDDLKRRGAYSDQEMGRVRKEKHSLADQLENVGELVNDLPETVSSAVDLIEKLFPTRIRFTQDAKDSAAAASLRDVAVAWRCLHSVATVLHRLLFDDESSTGDVAKAFREATGFEMSLTEGASTKSDRKLVALRRVQYHGREIDITPHIKWGNKEPKLLRVHFFADTANGLVIVGHCGDHMDTSGTRRRG